jgi:hypothetical protein
MKQLFFISLFILIGWEAECQTLIADETTIAETKTNVKITTCNDSFFVRILETYEPVLERYSVAKKEIKRVGLKYKEYTLFFPLDKKEELIRFIQSIKIEYK